METANSEIMIETMNNLIPTGLVSTDPSDTVSDTQITKISSHHRDDLHWSSDVLSILFSLTNWLRGIEEKHFDEEEYKEKEKELWKEWEWVLSTTEEFILKQNQLESEKVLGELNNLKKTASNLKMKPTFIRRANDILKPLSDEQLDELRSPLDSNKRSAVISTVINTMESQWLKYIKDRFFHDEILGLNGYESEELPEDGWIDSSAVHDEDSLSSSPSSSTSSSSSSSSSSSTSSLHEALNFSDRPSEDTEIKHSLRLENTSFDDIIILNKNINRITWSQFYETFKGQKYSKGITSRMKDIGFQASHGVDGTLNSRILGDITWSIWNTLNTALKQIRDLTVEESNELVDIVNLLQPVLLELWLNTKINSKVGAKNEGIVVEKWKKDEISRKKKILELKRAGKLDRYTGEKTIVMAHERREISSLRTTLEKKLKLKSK
ncbi:hypothetical protein SAMD00019534_031720, partial [Acytostelium subglobosum LB1]|uniref:hypothetical protein n=1 Tax=Acytostelium subglobosum LB1 TaxID=1410327 RepID=UPI000644CC1E